MTFTINKECSKLTIKARRNSAKTCPKLTKTSKQYDRHCCGIPAVKFVQVPHPMQCFYYISWTDICVQSSRLQVHVRKKKNIYTKCKSEKITKAVQHYIIDLKMELSVKIFKDFKV